MISKDFQHVRVWVFDLDNTLYHPSARLFDQIEVKMTDWLMRNLALGREEADLLRSSYWQLHGTTLAGLMHEHEVDPVAWLEHVHDISLSHLTPDALLARQIGALPGRRIIFTNGTAPYAERVLEARGLSGLFDAVYGVEHASYRPKPRRDAFEAIFALDNLDPAEGAMFEDDPRNLAVPHALGMRTVHVAEMAAPAPHIHHHTDDLAAFLGRLQERVDGH
ncbi:pyrimidine 5'-nucleotidase [Falsirhodobacter sp. 20TX0035]|uniref:pyrimidine 5'-nucleotidase n=1 Tax=Falsirhodobacter sp. 20TX0035 TaxID=3022019 RepID=UPI0023302005|nr:pyrimidine 5'-nucleotidase [Falsirhodobacter sp. 20TX0035]MDB6454859.1 pyrimidine 5'-nucleotidase [Falsirhodobacter sp. 20TX0035]